MDFDSFAQLSEQLGKEQATGRVRRNRKGETIVTFNTPVVSHSTTNRIGAREVTFQISRPKKQQVNLGKLSAADLVDKDRRIYFDVYDDADITRTLQETYGPGVNMRTSHQFSNVLIDEVQVPTDFNGKGVQKHIVESYIAGSREDLYGFGLADGVLTHEEATELGFQPNPYYWAGKTHPITKHAYPTREELEKKIYTSNPKDRYRFHFGSTLYAARDMEAYPYMRTHLFQAPFELLEFNRTTELNKDERAALSEATAGREEAWLKRKRVLSGWEARKPSLRVH